MEKKSLVLSLPEHPAISLLKETMRADLIKTLGGFIAKNPEHPKVISLTDPKRWDARFKEIIEGFSPEPAGRVEHMLEGFILFWNELEPAGRQLVAYEIKERIIAERTLENVKKGDPNFFLPRSRTLQ